MIKVKHVNGKGDTASEIDRLGSACVVNQVGVARPHGTRNQATAFAGYLGAVGLVEDKNSLVLQSNGLLPAANMLQNGIGTLLAPLKYFAEASPDYDIHITKIIFLHTWNKDHFDWGVLAAPLINGYQINAIENGVTTHYATAKTSGEMVISSGNGSKVGELKKWVAVGKVDALIVEYPVNEFIPEGLRLGRGTTDRLEAVVQDDMSLQVDQFVFVLGYKLWP